MPYVSEALHLTFQEDEYRSPAVQPVTVSETFRQSIFDDAARRFDRRQFPWRHA